MKVVRLLQDTKAELEKELEDDKAVHEKMTCWCTANEQEKNAAIESEKARISQLESSMDASTGKIAELKEKRKGTMDEIQSDTKALKEATELRFKENKAFHGAETDLLEAIDAAKNAIIVLSKHNPQLTQLKSVAHRLLDPRVSQLMSNTVGVGGVGKASIEYLSHFLHNAETATSFVAIPGMKSYAPQSGQIFGIINQMKEDFEANLSEQQKAEANSQAQYDALKAAKEDEIATGQKLVVSIDAGIAEFQEKHAQAAKERKDTMEQLGLDTEFIAALEKKCSETGADFDKRVKARMAEIAAVGDTIQILNSDEAFEAADKSVNSFLQTSSTTSAAKDRRQRAAKVLQQSGAAELLVLANSVQLDAFTKVKEEIDKLVAELKTQQAEEVAKRDYCTDEFNKNKRLTAGAYDKKDSLTTKIADLEQSIKTLETDIAAATDAVAEMKVQMKKASETREAENADFQTTISDHHVMAIILDKALARMKQVYAFLQSQAPGAPHIQTSGTATDPGNGPAKFKKYEQNAGGGRVVNMLEEIIADVKATVDEAHRSEQDAQSA